MHKRIFIVIPSDIIARGLMSVAQSLTVDCTRLQRFENLGNFQHLEDGINVILFDENLSQNFETVDLLKKQKNTSFIKVVHQQLNESNNSAISVYQSEASIKNTIESFFKTHENTQAGTNSIELTQREKDVLKLVALGHQNKEIAEKLHISFHTVISHRKNITEKLGIKSISGLTVYAILNKLIDPESIDPETLI